MKTRKCKKRKLALEATNIEATFATFLLVICFVAPFTLGGDAERSILRESVQDAPVEAPGVLPTTPGAPGPEVPGQTPGAPQEAPPTADE